METLRKMQPITTGDSSPPKGIIRIVQHERSHEKDGQQYIQHTSSKTNMSGHNNSDERGETFNRQSWKDNEFSRARNDLSRARNELSRAQNEISKAQNEIAGSRNVLERTGIVKREMTNLAQDVREAGNALRTNVLTRSMPHEEQSKRSFRSSKSNNINDGEQSETSEGRGSSGKRHPNQQYHHQHHHHHHNHHNHRRDAGEEGRRQHYNSRVGHHGSVRDNDSLYGSRLDDSNMASSSNAIGISGRSTAGSASTGKLFDPRKDDPVRFAAAAASRKGGMPSSFETGTVATMSVVSMSDSRSFTSSAAPSTTTMSTVSSDGRERRRRRGGPGSRTTTDSGEGGSGMGGKRKGHGGGGEGAMSDNNSYVIELKRRYRDVVVLERKLQEEHKLAAEQERKFQADQQASLTSTTMGGSTGVGGNMARSISSHKQNSNRQGFNPDGSLMHSYWLDLIAKHRTLAEVHVAFMEAALRPGLPASLHSLPQSYKIPTRLWHTAFHSLLERFRQIMPDWQKCQNFRETGISPKDRERCNEIVDLFTEYIYFAYSYYTNLLESELFKVFRSSWIENLGDLARYRMAAAKIMSYLGIRDGVRHGAERRDSGSHKRPINERSSSTETQTPNPNNNNKNKKGEEEVEGEEVEEEALEVISAQMGKDRASIGVAAAQDWDLEEKEIWRSTARGWYAKGLADVPGTGRLHHHLGILSRDDDLRSLYHFCKSLTASHPYTNARESILPLFERSSQTRRIAEDASIIDLFVYLHGILFTKIQLDDFDVSLVRFKQMLKCYLREKEFNNATNSVLLSPSSWMMMATINIAAMLQYNSIQESQEATKVEQNSKEVENKDEGKNKALPVEDNDGGNDEGEDEEGEDDEGNDRNNEEDQTIDAKDQAETYGDVSELPHTTQKACQLAFGMLELLITDFIDNNKQVPNPYLTLLLTFFSQECKNGDNTRKMERYVPWESLIALGNSIPSSVEPIDPRNDTSLKIRSDAIPLPEDWCLRGMAWVGRKVYERGFWKPHKVERLGLRSSLSLYENELDMIDRCTRCQYKNDRSDSTSSGKGQHDVVVIVGDDGQDDDDEDEEDEDDQGNTSSLHPQRPKLTLTLLRWRRIIHALTILIKTVPGMDFDIGLGNVHARHGRLLLAPPLNHKVLDWRAQETRAEVENAIGSLTLAKLEGRDRQTPEPVMYTDEEDDDDGDEMRMPLNSSESDSKEVQELIEMRNNLRKQLQEAKLANHLRPSTDSTMIKHEQKASKAATKFNRPLVRLVAGYTTLLLDTNVMLTPTDILSQLIKTKRWMIVIPLPVITELDGLKRREGDVGKRAQDALRFLEKKIQSHSTQLKVQTSRGNYLSDLRFRVEDIDFSATEIGGDEKKKDSEEAVKVAMARTVDDVILRCLNWQASSHFRNRLLLLCPDDQERAKKEQEIAKNIQPPVAQSVLVTLDRNLRIKARFQKLSAIGPSELIDILLQDSRASN